LGPFLVLMAISVAIFSLYEKRQEYERTPVSTAYLSDELKSALSMSKESKKNVVAMFTTSWCGSCQYMKRDVLPSSAVQAESGRFIWIFLDGDDPVNEAAMRQYGVDCYPTFCILNENGRELAKQEGASSPRSFAGFLAGY